MSDPSNVDHYRLYLLGGGFVLDELLFETPSNTTFPATFAIRWWACSSRSRPSASLKASRAWDEPLLFSSV